MTDPLLRALDELVSSGAGERGDWTAVLAAAGLSVASTTSEGRPRRLTRRRTLVGCIIVAAVAVITATPAFGLHDLIVNLVGGRTSVSFSKSQPAPPAIKKLFLDMAIGAPRGMNPHVLPDEARQIVFRGAGGRRRVLWVAPTRTGGFCSVLDGAGGGCISPSSEQLNGPLQIDGSYVWRVGQQPRILEIDGHVFSPRVATLQLAFQDHSTLALPFVYVSEPINAGFFITGIPSQHQVKGRWPTKVIARAKNGAIIATKTIQPPTQPLRPIPPNIRFHPQPPRSLPAAGSVEPTAPTQTGSDNGVTAIAGANGQVQLTASNVPAQVTALLRGPVSISCFRLTREYGIFTVRGDGTNGRFANSIGLTLNDVGRPLDGCEIATGRGHRWPDKLNSHSPIEIPFTAKGRAYFQNRAAARDLALFVRSARMQQIRRQPAAQLLRNMKAAYGPALAHSHIRYTLTPTGITFSETANTGRAFRVTITHGHIAHNNVAPYAMVF